MRIDMEIARDFSQRTRVIWFALTGLAFATIVVRGGGLFDKSLQR